MTTTWLTVREAAAWSGRPLVEVVNAMLAGDLSYAAAGDEPLEWLIDQVLLELWAGGRE